MEGNLSQRQKYAKIKQNSLRHQLDSNIKPTSLPQLITLPIPLLRLLRLLIRLDDTSSPHLGQTVSIFIFSHDIPAAKVHFFALQTSSQFFRMLWSQSDAILSTVGHGSEAFSENCLLPSLMLKCQKYGVWCAKKMLTWIISFSLIFSSELFEVGLADGSFIGPFVPLNLTFKVGLTMGTEVIVAEISREAVSVAPWISEDAGFGLDVWLLDGIVWLTTKRTPTPKTKKRILNRFEVGGTIAQISENFLERAENKWEIIQYRRLDREYCHGIRLEYQHVKDLVRRRYLFIKKKYWIDLNRYHSTTDPSKVPSGFEWEQKLVYGAEVDWFSMLSQRRSQFTLRPYTSFVSFPILIVRLFALEMLRSSRILSPYFPDTQVKS